METKNNTSTGTPRKLVHSLKDKKKAQPNAVLFLSDAERSVIKETIAKKLTEPQYKIFIYTCQALGLNPLLNEIACVVYTNRNTGEVSMSIQVMRDGFLTIAHRSGMFAGLESGVNVSEDGSKILSGWSKVYHKNFTVPLYQEADFEEYYAPEKGGKPTLWKSKPKTMIKKVAESMALRKAFNINGVYAPEEMDKEIHGTENRVPLIEDLDAPATNSQVATLKALGVEKTPNTKGEAIELIKNATKK